MKHLLKQTVILTLLLAFPLLEIHAQITLLMKEKPASEVVKQVEKVSKYRFFYKKGLPGMTTPITVEANDQSIEAVMGQIVKQIPVSYTIKEETQVVLTAREHQTMVSAQSKVVKGVVNDASGEPLIGANVSVKGTTIGTITDADGRFLIEVPDNAVLVVSYIGYNTQDISVTSQNTYTIKLKEDTKALEEVIVVGYTSQKKELLTGAVSNMKVDEKMKHVPVTSPVDILAGQMPGVNIITGDGLPGVQSSISIRTQSSWNTQSVLYVIDGIISNDSDFKGLSVNEIENVTVLKDASSAAIYGSRAAGGVIVVTTKLGSYGEKIKIDYSFNTGFSRRGKNQELTDAAQTAEYYMQINPSSDPAGWAWTPEEIEWVKTINGGWGYDMVDAVWQDPKLTTHNISVSGGSQRVKFFAGASFSDQRGFLQQLRYKKSNFRLNLTAKITEDLDFYGGLALNNQRTNSVTGNSIGDVRGIYTWLLGWQPDDPIWTDGGLPIDPTWTANVAAQVRGDAGYIHDNTLRPSFNTKLTYRLPVVKGLSFSAGYSSSYSHFKNKTFQQKYKMYVLKRDGFHKTSTRDEDIIGETMSTQITNNFLTEISSWNNSWQYNLQMSYDRVFNDDHSVKATFVFEKNENDAGGMAAGVEKFPVYLTDNWWAASSNRQDSWVDQNPAYTDQKSGRQSWIGQLFYDYQGKYLLGASYRYDGSMNFSPEKRWGFFPSGSVGWVISKESFFNTKTIEFMKLRASVGLTGNDAIGGWQWQQTYNAGGSAHFGTTNGENKGIRYGALPNKDLTWEKSRMINVAVDMRFLDNFSLTAEYYNTHTYDILGVRSLEVPPTFTLSLPAQNYGVINAQGVELNLGYTDTFGDFLVNGGLSIAYGNANFATYDDDKVAYDHQKRVGRSLTTVYGFKSDGIIRSQEQLDAFNAAHPDYNIRGIKPELGMLVYKDLSGPDGIPDGVINDHDIVILKKKNNPVVMGITLGAEWKGLAVNAVFNGNIGQERMNMDLFHGNEWDRSWVGAYEESWTPEHPDAMLPKRIHVWNPKKTYSENSDFWLKKSSFLRLKNLNVSYTIPEKIYGKLGIDKVDLFFTGSNLFVISSWNKNYYDPEIGNGKAFPIMKSYNFGFNISL